MAASRQHLTTLGLGTPGGLLVTFGLGRITPFVPNLPSKPVILIGPDPSERCLTGPDPSERVLDGPDPSERVLDGPDPTERKLDGPDPSERILDGAEEPC